ncbi:NIPSNAP protein [Rhizobiales bacterium GAS188]|nr:NIPSNAP protein [Rhizobiales bacterium GAS188]
MTQAVEPNSSMQASREFCSAIIDLRQYTLYPGTRDVFIELFDREFVETQEAAGMRIIGQFRDLGDPNRFVWMRGFPDMPSRKKALTAFYVHGEAWKQHSEAARSKMIDSSDALLLHPVRPGSAFALEAPVRRSPPESEAPQGLVVAALYHLPAPMDPEFLGFFDDVVAPALIAAGGRLLGLFATEHSPNNFPRLPLRESENVFIAFLGFGELEAYHRHMTALGQNPQWQGEIYPTLLRRLETPPQILRLAPTSRSQLRA